MRNLGTLLVLAAAATACGCGTADVAVLAVTGAPDGSTGASTGADAQLAPDAVTGVDTLTEYCNASGPPALIDQFAEGGTATTCPELLAQRAFLYALCACADFVSDQALVTDAFNGAQGAYSDAGVLPGGSVGINGSVNLNPSAPMQVNGSFWASGASDINAGPIDVAGELHAEGELRPTSLFVGADAWMAGGIQTTGGVTVNGAVHVPAGAPIDVPADAGLGAPLTQAFQVAPACDCTPQDLVDVAGVVATYAMDNDDQVLGIEPTWLENVQSAVTATLPCGRIYLASVGGNAPIQLTVKSHVALFVGADISTDSDFEIDVPSGGELDLFVAGSLTVSGSFLVGTISNPARARTYVGGSTVNLQNAATLAGNLYAPKATLTLGASAPTTLYGSIFAERVSASADLTIHYDEAILSPSATAGCPAPQACSSCSDCGGQACNDGGACGACARSSDCCPPLVCGSQGTCVSDVVTP
jgi:hypothetical protein